MTPQRAEGLTDALRSNLGDGLRTIAVGSIPDRDYEVTYIRPDVDDQYTDEMREDIFQDLVLERVAEGHQQDLFPPLGDLEYTVRVFEGGINIVGWRGEAVVFVGLDDDESLIPSAISACRQVL